MDRRQFLRSSAVLPALAAALPSSSRLSAGDSPEVSDSIWDLHCHLLGVPGSTVKERLDQMLIYADRMRVEKLVYFMGLAWSSDPTPDDFRRQNDEVLEALRLAPRRLLGFAYLNGNYPEESLAEVERCIAQGPMVGIKLWTARRCSDLEMDPIIQRCGELQAVVYQHSWVKAQGNLPGESTPMDVADMARRHPDVRIICGHSGGDWTLGIRAVRSVPHVTIDLGGSEPTAGFVEMAVRELGTERVLYGSDIGGRSFASQLAKVYGAQITPEQRRLILGQNLQRLLTPILKSKGGLT